MLKYNIQENETIVVISLYANPLGVHHLNYIEGAAQKGKVYAIINNDKQVELKGSYYFQSEQDRLRLVSSLRSVWASRLSIDQDSSVVKTLELIRKQNPYHKMIWANGGDRTPGNTNTVEEDFCRANSIDIEYNVGGGKTGSSSKTLQNFLDRYWLNVNRENSKKMMAEALCIPLRGLRSNNVICDDFEETSSNIRHHFKVDGTIKGWYSGSITPNNTGVPISE